MMQQVQKARDPESLVLQPGLRHRCNRGIKLVLSLSPLFFSLSLSLGLPYGVELIGKFM